MAKYIDKDALVAEIERRISDNKKEIERASHKNLEDYFEGYEDALALLKQFLDTLEVKETTKEVDMTKIATTIEQSKKLIKLGLNRETSDMFYWCGTDLRIGGYKAQDKDTDISAWSLSALLELMPKIDNLKPMIDLEGNSIYYSGNNAPCVEEKTILDAAFNMICLLLKEKKL